MTRGLWWLPAILLACGGCGLVGAGSGDDPDPADAEQELLAQQAAVAATAQTLVSATRDELGGEVLESQGRWEGCTSAFPEGFQDFRYAADVRLAARPGTPEQIAGGLERVAQRSGLTVETAESGESVQVADGEVSAALVDIPDLGAEGDVLIRLVAGPCVVVPEDDRQAWLLRDADGPDVD